MIDTIKLAIPVTKSQQRKLQHLSSLTKVWRWVQFHPDEGLAVRRHPGIVITDGESYHRELRWDVNDGSQPRFYLEFSVPKFWQGHNIYLLYDWVAPLNHLRKLIQNQCSVKLPRVEQWELCRLDLCYAWAFPSQPDLDAYFENLRGIRMPYKRDPVWRKDSVFFPGTTYSAKLYKKLPEFKAHDRPALLKDGMCLEWVNYLEDIATGVLRFECVFRRQWLKNRGLLTVGDIVPHHNPIVDPLIEWDDSICQWQHFLPEVSVWLILSNIYDDDELINSFHSQLASGSLTTLKDGEYFSLQSPLDFTIEYDGNEYHLTHPAGGFHVRQYSIVMQIIQEMLTKMIGEGCMHSDNEVKKLLLDTYKPVKAARLTAFWLYVQRFGVESAKEIYGRESFYQSRSDLKKAGIDLIERPSNVTYLDDDFWRSFRMKAPSIHVVNKADNDRGQLSIFNIRKTS